MPGAGDLISATDINTLIDGGTGKPHVKLVQTVAQTLTNNASTSILFDTEVVDTHGYHSTSTNTDRITPTKAGRYQVTGTVALAAATTTTSVHALVAKNGVTGDASVRQRPASLAQPGVAQVTATVDINGTGDFITLVGVQLDSGAASRLTNVVAAQRCAIEVTYVRDL